VEFVEVRRNFVMRHDGTHGRRGDIRVALVVSSQHLVDAIVMSHIERCVLARRVEISGILDRRSSDITTRRRGIAVPFLDDPHNRGGRTRCVVCFDDPGFILLHANCGIVTHIIPTINHRVYRESTIWSESGGDSDEDCLNGSPFKIDLHRVEGNNFAVVRRTSCSAHVGTKT